MMDRVQSYVAVPRDVRMKGFGEKTNHWRLHRIRRRNLHREKKDASFVWTAMRTSDGCLPMTVKSIQRSSCAGNQSETGESSIIAQYREETYKYSFNDAQGTREFHSLKEDCLSI